MAETLPIIDSHVHLWNPDQLSMPWLADVPALHRCYGLQKYRQQTQDLPIMGIVYVEVGVGPQQALREAHHIVELAREEPRLQAILTVAPVEQGAAVREHLKDLVALSPLIKGGEVQYPGRSRTEFLPAARFRRGCAPAGGI